MRIMHFGLGPIGQAILDLTRERDFASVAAVDVAPNLVGTDLGQLLEPRCELGVEIHATAAQAMAGKPEVALLATGSRLEAIIGQIEDCLDAGCHVVSTCEELVFPWRGPSKLADRIDCKAREAGLVVLGTGINPGYLMDYLPLVCAGLCRSISRIEIRRHQDASHRRRPFQAKIGAGMTPEAFAEKMAAPIPIGHVGLTESVELLAHGLGWKLDEATEVVEPYLAPQDCSSPHFQIAAGQVAGLRQVAQGIVDGQERIRLEFVAAVGLADAHEAIEIDGDPPVRMRMEPVHGDRATAAAVVNCILGVAQAQPGLRTMADFAVARGIPLVP